MISNLLKNALILSIALCLNFEASAQGIYKAAKGHVIKYDSAAIMELWRYRVIKKDISGAIMDKFAFMDSVRSVIAAYEQEAFMLDQYTMGQDREIDLLYARIDAKDSLIAAQRVSFDNLMEATKPKKQTFWQKNRLYILPAGAFLLGLSLK